MQALLQSVSGWYLKEAYHKALKDVAGHSPSLQRVDRGYDILVRDSIYTIKREQNAAQLMFRFIKNERGEIAEYTVIPAKQSCTCPDAAESKNLCKHRLAIKMIIEALRLQKAAQQRIYEA